MDGTNVDAYALGVTEVEPTGRCARRSAEVDALANADAMSRTQPPDSGAFVAAVSPALRQAAALARALEGQVVNEPKTGEATDVKQALTLADTASQEALLVSLLEHFPRVALAAEEDTPSVARFPATSDALVVIDPIDGTLHSYLSGEGPYAVMVGLAVRGRYEASLVALPREGLFFEAIRGGGARSARAGREARPTALHADPSGRVLVSHGMPQSVIEAVEAIGMIAVPACGGAVSVAPLIPGVRAGLRFASGAGGVSIRGRIGVLIAREAGACVSGARGATFPDDLETEAPILCVARNEEDLAVLGQVFSSIDPTDLA